MAEHALQIRASYIQRENLAQLARQIKKFSRYKLSAKVSATRHYGGVMSRGGGSIHGIYSSREQRSIVKISYSKNTKTRSWAAHGAYLQRQHAQEKNHKGIGFNDTSIEIDIQEILLGWQGAGDEHFFKLIISPENGHYLDLQQHAIELIKHAEHDLKTKLEWVAIDHYDTDQPHIHLLIRGVDEQKQKLIVDSKYIADGFRQRSQMLATNRLGLRTINDLSLARQREINKSRFTTIDRSLRNKAINNVVSYENKIPKSSLTRERRLQEIARLKYLESLGLAEHISKKKWRLAKNFEFVLQAMQLSGDIIKSRAQHGVRPVDLSNYLKPTEITKENSITGRVIGMGLDNEIFDRRYLLIDGLDGKVHYIRATESIVKARDSGRFANGDLITLKLKTFLPKQQIGEGTAKSKTYVAVINHKEKEQINKLSHKTKSRNRNI